jgi:hypothetical protein
MNRSIAATIIGIVVAVGLALLTQPEWLLDFLPTRRIGLNLIFTFVMVSSHYLERSELEPTLRPRVCSVDKALRTALHGAAGAALNKRWAFCKPP